MSYAQTLTVKRLAHADGTPIDNPEFPGLVLISAFHGNYNAIGYADPANLQELAWRPDAKGTLIASAIVESENDPNVVQSVNPETLKIQGKAELGFVHCSHVERGGDGHLHVPGSYSAIKAGPAVPGQAPVYRSAAARARQAAPKVTITKF